MSKPEPKAELKPGKPFKLNLKRLRPFLIPALIILAIVSSAFLLLRPRVEKISLVQRQLGQKEDRLAQLSAKVATLEGLDEFELSSRAELMAKAFPPEKNFPLFLSVLKQLMTRNNLETVNLEVTPGDIATISAEVKKGPPSMVFSLKLSGQMNDLKQFLGQVARTAPLMIIQDLTIEVIGGGVVEGTLTIEGPFLALPITLGATEKPLSQITLQEEEIYQKLSRFDFSLVKEESFLSVPGGKENPFTF